MKTKKIVSIIMAIICVFGCCTMAYAESRTEEFSNSYEDYTPYPGSIAPSNWYDPNVYDDNGQLTISATDYSYHSLYYCYECHKFFKNEGKSYWWVEWSRDADDAIRYDDDVSKRKYISDAELRSLSNEEYELIVDKIDEVKFCPYCGEMDDFSFIENLPKGYVSDFYEHHEVVNNCGECGWYFGNVCPECGMFNYGSSHSANCCFGRLNSEEGTCVCGFCYKTIKVPDKIYRVISEDLLDKEYYPLFEASAHYYGDGVDAIYEKMEFRSDGYMKGFGSNFKDSDSGSNSFFDKIIDFFKSIGEFFKNLFSSIGNLFKF